MSLRVLKMTDLDLKGQRVLIREDLNVPVADGKVTSDARIRAALPTLQAALKAGARVMVMSHLGRPKEGEFDAAQSLAPVAERLTSLLGTRVRYALNPRTFLAGFFQYNSTTRQVSSNISSSVRWMPRRAAALTFAQLLSSEST